MSKQKNVTPSLWLGSQSPRRQMLLEALGLKFRTVVSHADEADIFGGSVEETVKENARRKAQALLPALATGDVLITADTLVAQGEKILSKPADREEALSHLRAFSGKTHRVLTGLGLVSKGKAARMSCTETLVTFRTLSESEIAAYVDTGEPYDKAGGYGIQGVACLFVQSVQGSFSNVMGLPTETLLRELQAYTGVSPFAWLAK
ncbi:Maf family protein [bacterium]|nr:Maf family protein [bacterium]